MARANRAILWFSEIDKDDIPLVGGKGANLGEIARAEFPVPDGFVITAAAYFAFLRENKLMTKIRHLLSTVHFERPDSLLRVSSLIKKEIVHGEVSEKLKEELFFSYEKLGGILNNALVAVRSSATAEDLPTASFAGQQETFLNVKGEANLLIKVIEAWASLFEARAIFYRHDKHFDHFRVGIAIVVQKMVVSDASGVMFTIDPVTNEKGKIVIEAVYGLGEMIVQGRVTPDHYEVAKNDFFIRQKIVEKQTLLLKKVDTKNKEVRVPESIAARQKITNKQIVDLA